MNVRKCGLGVVGLLVGLAVATAAWAQEPAPQHGAKKGKGVVEELKKAHHLLVEADHDYDGHRAKAAHEVHEALKELGHEHKKGEHAGKKGEHAGKKAEKPREPQAKSDAQLREAREILDKALAHLTTKHPKAAEKVTAAIAEIDTALKIK